MAKTRVEKIKEMVDEVENWDVETLIDFTKQTVEAEYQSMSNADIDLEYEDSGLGDEDEYVPITCTIQAVEEECSTCKRIKDVGSKCWCCGN